MLFEIDSCQNLFVEMWHDDTKSFVFYFFLLLMLYCNKLFQMNISDDLIIIWLLTLQDQKISLRNRFFTSSCLKTERHPGAICQSSFFYWIVITRSFIRHANTIYEETFSSNTLLKNKIASAFPKTNIDDVTKFKYKY